MDQIAKWTSDNALGRHSTPKMNVNRFNNWNPLEKEIYEGGLKNFRAHYEDGSTR
uniref:Uncharacterized protein n=1 Tax=Lepeophtheirus salmonis TaxID=72036 RepID=A0A0K2TTA0_LEPSM